ncbi:TlpA family protein disulfide reductase [Dokdonella immobilis]|uniref:Thiol-disulfide isomerase or thioredoxin n=1 Tax=Dokdonella immobilis TaxID=578942 RepID=A0A1I5B994_9GAMM|nr:TlpA disulfide reductase family protein [Dokdonella immobilis]SFN71298.1 Thiol-disulfide isomerase or thioredoxin [Dokdonella immobilis]
MNLRHCLLLASLLAFSATARAADTESARQPTLKVDTLDGKTFDLASQRGKWVVVNFWATWCAPCVAEMPELSAFIEAREDVVGIGLAYEDTDRQEIIDFLKQRPVSYPIAQVDVNEPPKDFDTPRGLPTTYLIAPDGTVARHFLGPIKDKDLVQAMAARKPAKKP